MHQLYISCRNIWACWRSYFPNRNTQQAVTTFKYLYFKPTLLLFLKPKISTNMLNTLVMSIATWSIWLHNYFHHIVLTWQMIVSPSRHADTCSWIRACSDMTQPLLWSLRISMAHWFLLESNVPISTLFNSPLWILLKYIPHSGSIPRNACVACKT